ncbi:MAG: glycosyltransferase [Clostridia bacterium]|nr:glycosyltransferase [Clostridia bacterium]
MDFATSKPCVSVIIPVYNVEKYLRRCLDSVINQTYSTLEIILIDDGSLDSSGFICDEYAQRDKRFKVIHQSNGGVSFARNTGLEIANGEYISFVDSDDCIANNYFEILMKCVIENKAEVVGCDVFKFRDDSQLSDEIGINDTNMYILAMTLLKAMEKHSVWDYVCGKIYKKEILKGQKFDLNLRFGEDALFNLNLCCEKNNIINQVYYINRPLYFYFQRDNSAVHNSSYKDIQKRIYVYLEYFSKKEVLSAGKTMFAKVIIKDLLSFRYLAMYEGEKNSTKKFVKETFYIVFGYLKKEKVLSIKEKAVFKIFYYIPLLYRIFRILGDKTMLNWEKASRKRAKINKLKKDRA